MKKKILVNAVHPEECRVAILDGDRLQDIHIETGAKEHTKGNIYKGIIVKVEPGLQAAFVDFGHEKHGFLQFREIQSKYFQQKGAQGKDNEQNGKPRIQEVLNKRQEVLVQVEKEQRDQKGASLTTYISLAGRYMVAMPGQGQLGISRKIEDEKERQKIKEVFEKLNPPKDMGFIVRTAAAGETKATLSRDLKYLLDLWKKIEDNAKKAKAPALIHKEEDIVIRAIRDYLTPDVEEVLVDHPDTYKNAREFFRTYQPKYQRLIRLYREARPIFAAHGVEEQIEEIHHREVRLPSGGSIVIDTGEALTAIDVNSGRTHGEKDIEALAFHTNLEAVAEITRQLRLRDLGGLIVIDFIDMKSVKNNREVEKVLKQALKKDKAHTDITRISRFGLLELSRERMRPSFRDIHYVPCATCEGTGYVKSDENLALYALRKLQALVAGDDAIVALTCRLPVGAANYLVNRKRESLNRFVANNGFAAEILADFALPPGRVQIEIHREEEASPEILSEGPSEDTTSQKKRKRKRKKKKKTAAAEETGNPPAQTPKEESPALDGARSEPFEVSGAQAAEGRDIPTGKRKRRRRPRRSSRGSEERAANGAVGSDETPVTDRGMADASPSLAAISDRKPVATSQAGRPEDTEVKDPAPRPSSPVEEKTIADGGKDPSSPPARKKRRTSRARRTSAAAAAAKLPSEKTEAPEASPATAVLSPEAAAAKPKRPARKKSSSRRKSSTAGQTAKAEDQGEDTGK